MTGDSLATLQAEAARELEARQRTFPRRVASGNMLEAEAQRQLAIASAWVDDLQRLAANPIGRLPAATHGIPWHERHAALLREMAMRERLYPRWVAEGRVVSADADARMARLAAIIRHYEDGPLYESRTGAVPRPHGFAGRTDEERDARLDWLEMQRDRALARGDGWHAQWMARCLAAEGIVAETAAA